MTLNKKNIKILENNPPIIKRINQYIIKSSKKINQKKSQIYIRLPNGYQFGGELDQNYSGKGILINNNEEYYLDQCQIIYGVIDSYRQKRNLISNCQILENPIPDLTLEQLVSKLYTQYLSKEISHKIILLFTPQTNQFFKNKNPNEHQTFRNAYKDYVVIFIHLKNNLPNQQLKNQLQFALILRNGEVNILCNSTKYKLSSEFYNITSFLRDMKYKKSQIHECPCIYQDIGINESNLNISQNKQSSLTLSCINLINLFSSTQFTPKYKQSKTNNGYFIIPLISKAFDLNQLSNKDLNQIVSITNYLHILKCSSIYQRVESMLQNKIEIYTLQEILDDINKRIQPDKKQQLKTLICSSKI